MEVSFEPWRRGGSMADEASQVLLGSGLTVLSQPLMYVKVLVQVRACRGRRGSAVAQRSGTGDFGGWHGERARGGAVGGTRGGGAGGGGGGGGRGGRGGGGGGGGGGGAGGGAGGGGPVGTVRALPPQVGYEPLPPTLGRNIFGRQVYQLPGLFAYGECRSAARPGAVGTRRGSDAARLSSSQAYRESGWQSGAFQGPRPPSLLQRHWHRGARQSAAGTVPPACLRLQLPVGHS